MNVGSKYDWIETFAGIRMDIGGVITEKTALNLGFNIFNLYNQVNIISRPYSLSEEPIRDVMQGRSPLIFNEIQGRGFAANFFCEFHF